MIFRLSALFALLLLSACDDGYESTCKTDCTTVNQGGEMAHGSGNVTTQTRQVGHFTGVRLSASAKVVIKHTGTESLTVTGDDNLMSLFTPEVRDGILYLGYAKGKSFEGKRPVYGLTVNELTSVAMDGSGEIDASKLEGSALSVSVSGSGEIRLDGQVANLKVSVGGSGSVDAAKLQAKQVNVTVDGSGAATVNASESLVATVNGSGSIAYLGQPKVSSHVAGSGSVGPKT